MPFNLASSIFNFLKGDTKKTFAKVIGDKVNRRAGYRLVIPCVWCLSMVHWTRKEEMKKLVKSLVAKRLV